MRKLETAKILLDIGAVTLNPPNPYKYACGLLSPIYVDCRMISSFPKERRTILSYFVEYIDAFIGRNNVDLVVGSGPSGISLATYLSEKLRLPMAYVRESAKTHGKTNKIEGIVKENQRVLLIGDIFATENHIQNSVNTLKELKTNIVQVLAMFSLNLDTVERFLTQEGIKFHTLCDLKTLIDVAFFEKKISVIERTSILNWLSNPSIWHESRFGSVREDIAKILLKIKSVTLRPNEPYKFVSGILSPIYCDNRLLMSHPNEWRLMIDSMLSIIVNKIGVSNIDIIAGTATAGISHAAYVAEQLKLPMIYITAKPKEYGKGQQIEGVLEKGQRVLIVEDLISTGGSSFRAVEAVRKAGGIVNTCLAIFTYEMEKAKKKFEEGDCNLITLSDFSTLIKVAADNGYIKSEDQTKVLEWSKDPAGWGKKMGFE